MFTTTVGMHYVITAETRAALLEKVTEYVFSNIIANGHLLDRLINRAMEAARPLEGFDANGAPTIETVTVQAAEPSYLETVSRFVSGAPSAYDTELKRAVRDLFIERNALVAAAVARGELNRISSTAVLPFTLEN